MTDNSLTDSDAALASPTVCHARSNRTLIGWLLVCAFMVFAMAVIGAITRLTESGLSIVDWRPVTGAIPPLTEADWQREFALYSTSPEYRLKNAGMSLDDFKAIFFWEWLHRLWGRLIGVVYALPFFWFLLRRRVPEGFAGRLWLLLALGGLQGVIGWFMVMSGLIDRPSVSHYRLALHLGTATLIFVLLVRTAVQIATRGHDSPVDLTAPPAAWPDSLLWHGRLALAMIAITMVWGAFVAGLDAGLFYNTFPLMDGAWLPTEFHDIRPLLPGFVDNPGLVQFAHRCLALTTAAVTLWFALRLLPSRQGAVQRPMCPFTRGTATGLAVMAVAQPVLGIATLLTHVNIPLAALHQAGALILILLMALTLQGLGRRRTPLSQPSSCEKANGAAMGSPVEQSV